MVSLYRPFFKQYLYFNKQFNTGLYRITELFPDEILTNEAICISGLGANKNFSALAVNSLFDVQLVSNGQCFSLNSFNEEDKNYKNDLFNSYGSQKFLRLDNINSKVIDLFKTKYNKEKR